MIPKVKGKDIGYPGLGLRVRSSEQSAMCSFGNDNLTKFLDWKLSKPKMHLRGKSDPPPDSDEFLRHAVCEHGMLSINGSLRRRITSEVSEYNQLNGVFL